MTVSSTRSGFCAGLAAGLLVAIAMYFGWFTHHIPAVALALWERQMRLIPLQVFSFLIVRLKFAAKPAAFWGMLAGLVVLLGLIGAVVARWAGGKPGRLLGLPAEITPNDRFYIVSKNPPGFDPVVEVAKWSLDIGGLVSKPVRFSFEDLRAMPAIEQVQTLECISNEVGGDLISNAKWKGVQLRDVLMRAGGPAATAVKVAFRCADGYSESIPVADAMHPTTLLAYEMNGEPLPTKHGFPVRLLVPGSFGMKNPKWITKIEVVNYDFRGYWEASGWSDEAVVKTMSEFTVAPRSGTV